MPPSLKESWVFLVGVSTKFVTLNISNSRFEKYLFLISHQFFAD